MNEHAVPDRPTRPPEQHILHPAEARSRHKERRPHTAGLQYLRALSSQEREWMERMVAQTARRYGVDRDDLLQELQLSVLECDSIEAGRHQVRSWLQQRARWRALDLLRGERSHRIRLQPLSEVSDMEPTPPSTTVGEEPWDLGRLADLQLNRDEAQVVLLVMWGLGISLREFAELSERSYSKTRQDKVRGLRKIEGSFELDADERTAFVTQRKYDTVTAVVRLGIPRFELRRLVRQAEQKIDRVLGHGQPLGKRREDGCDEQ